MNNVVAAPETLWGWVRESFQRGVIDYQGSDQARVRVNAGTAALPSVARVDDTDTGIYWPAANQLGFAVNGVGEVLLTATALSPVTTDGNALGTTALMWSDLFLASGAVINFDNGNVTLTHAANALTVGGGDLLVANGFGVIIGHTAQVSIGGSAPEFQVIGTSYVDSTIMFGRWSGDGAGAELAMVKSRNATIGSFTIVQSGDDLGQITAYADDGTDYASPATQILFEIDATPGTNDVPGRITLWTTADGAATLTERLRIASTGLITIAAGSTPASVAGATGTAHAGSITATGGLGGDTSIATTGTGGNGGGFSFTGGNGGVAASATTASTGGNGGAFTVATGAGAVGTTTGAGNGTGGNGGAISLTTGAGGAVATSTGTNTGGQGGAFTLTTGNGGAAQDGTDTGGASGAISLITGTGGAGDTGGASGNITLRTGAVGAGGSPTVGSIIFQTGGANEEWRIVGSTGELTSLGAAPTNVTAQGAILAGGGIAMTDVLNAWIDDATHGDGTTTHYIGNQTITTASDVRLKTNIENTRINATDMFRRMRVVDFTWTDPDHNGLDEQNRRGRFTGMIAQEMVDIAPWIINAPDPQCPTCRMGQDCAEHKSRWFVQYEHLVPSLVKGFQELDTRVSALEAAQERIKELEAEITVLRAA